MKRIAFVLFVLLCHAQTGCRQENLDLTSPVVSMWDGGNHMIGEKPFVLFAAWSDGMVVRRTGERDEVGFVRPSEIADLVKAIKTSGFTTPFGDQVLDSYGMVFVDGPVLSITLKNGKETKTLYYHGRDEWNKLDQVGHNASPSKEHMKAFVDMWHRVADEIAKIKPEKMTDFKGDRKLISPWEKSQPVPERDSVPAAR